MFKLGNPVTPTVVVAIISSSTTLLGILANQIYSVWDRNKKAAQVADALEVARMLLAEQVQRHIDQATTQFNKLGYELNKNTEISVKAFQEANDVNLKIEQVCSTLATKADNSRLEELVDQLKSKDPNKPIQKEIP
jgi:hypothetical protein